MAMRALIFLALAALVAGEGLRLPDQQSSNNIQQVYAPQPAVQQIQQPQQPQQFPQAQQPGVGEERGRSSLLSIFGLGNDNDPFLARTNSNCLGGDLSACFKTQALNTFDEIFFKDQYKLSDFARVVRLPETQQRSLLQEPFEYSEEPRGDDDEWNQLLKYGLRRTERFLKSTALEVEWPEELTEAGRYEARFIGNDIDGELDLIDDGQRAGHFSRKKLKKMIIPLLLVLKIFKLKLLLFLPFILGIAGLKKILGLAAIILPGLFAYFKLCRPPGGVGGAFGGGLSGLFGGKNTFPEYNPQGVGAATYYHHHEHFEGGHGGAPGPYYRQEPSFAKPYTDYYSKSYQGQQVQGQQVAGNSVSFGDPQEAAYNGYYGRNSGKDIVAEQQPQKS
ncbi:uncharacterized protein LOC6537573 [Drosophila yakuba]|uniref:Uncharacterized protein, isoform A n=1 Tax=Drosophila yakuba TaxID=7245 RepID=B4PVM2_DROYA|nr:uncharacterized protein LOC6537573 [Drosophila yakuba]XP_015048422.1 uncharacterized protein LOC6537573 [Drosophila yakuba]XP_039231571.1 uncharacterized protein LOC6537573 [Drosophila yakuba]EDW97831.1 uncharacterized protein Dyak_GE10186, isoform A [Drosophila yakuba]KRK03994.1 uncharacterized protein Dyak_GE10186, isoform B [Drosophila yakuba]